MLPVRNAGPLIDFTIASLLSQNALREGGVSLHLVVQDGASSDDTVHRARRMLDRNLPPGMTADIRSEPDRGLYDALEKGFAATGAQADLFAYLNAGDLWAPTCLHDLTDIVDQTGASWICGLHAYFNAHGTLVHTRLPFRYKRELLRVGAYGRGLPTVQQESTFWSQQLHVSADWGQIATYRVAGDARLWWGFAEHAEPIIVQALLGGFTFHGDHLGATQEEYRREIGRFAGPLNPATRLRITGELPLWEQPARLKARMNPNLYLHSTTSGDWHSQRGTITPT